MRDDHVFYFGGLHTEQRQTLGRLTQKHAFAFIRHGSVKASIDHVLAPITSHQPYKIIHRHRRIVRITTDKMRGAPGVARGVLNGVNFIVRQAHEYSMVIESRDAFTFVAMSGATLETVVHAQ